MFQNENDPGNEFVESSMLICFEKLQPRRLCRLDGVTDCRNGE